VRARRNGLVVSRGVLGPMVGSTATKQKCRATWSTTRERQAGGRPTFAVPSHFRTLQDWVDYYGNREVDYDKKYEPPPPMPPMGLGRPRVGLAEYF
jgi:hypothetical protein